MHPNIRDKKSFELVFREYYPQLILYAKSIVKSTEASEDIVQEFFTSLWNKRNHVNIHSKIRSYFYQSIYNSCMNYVSRKQLFFEDLKEVNNPEVSQEEIIQKLERNKIINAAVNKLPEQRRRIFKLVFYEGLKYREAAAVLNISVNTVKTQVGRALSDLRKSLGDILLYFLLINMNEEK